MNNLETEKDFHNLSTLINKICNDEVYTTDHIMSQQEIDEFINSITAEQECVNLDMDKLDPSAVTFAEVAEKYSGFEDESVIKMLHESINNNLPFNKNASDQAEAEGDNHHQHQISVGKDS